MLFRLDINKLILNVKCDTFHGLQKFKTKSENTAALMIRGHGIEIVDSTKFLGVYLDSGHTWRNHIN